MQHGGRHTVTRKLELSARQVTALCKGASKAGYAPIVQIGNTLVRLLPEEHAIPPKPNADVDEAEDFRL